MRGVPRPRRLRLHLTSENTEQLKALFSDVPTETKIHRQWTSPAGQRFIGRADELRRAGVPVRWMAEELGMDDRVLLQIIDAQRRAGPPHRPSSPPPTSPGGSE